MTPARRILPYFKAESGTLSLAFLCMLAAAATQAGAVYLLKPVIDGIFVTKDANTLRLVLFAIPVLFAVKAVSMYGQSYLMGLVGQRVTQRLRGQLFRHLTALSVDYYWERKAGELLSRVTNDLNNVQNLVQFVPLFLVRDSLTVVALVGILFYLNAKFALVALVLLPLVGAFVGGLGKKMNKAAGKSQSHMGDLTHLFSEAFSGMAVIKAFHYEEGAARKFDEENDRYFGHIMRYWRATALTAPVLEFLGSFAIIALLYFGARTVFSGAMTAGDFFTFMGAFLAAYVPVKNLAAMNQQYVIGTVSVERLFHILDETPTVRESPMPKPFAGLTGSIVFENVGFKYPSRERWALKGLNVEIKRGESVAFVGPSGSGKSTLVHLLLRLIDPGEGRLLFDGADLKTIGFAGLRAHQGLVTQETVLFNDDVAANVALGRATDQAEIEAACRAANADGFIRELPQGYATQLGDRGVRLSGGQRQRLAIARAILKNPSILLLDEATSNLDSASERAVQESIAKLLGTRTVIMVAHRLSTIADADRIVVLQDGTVVEQGDHRTLLAAGGTYRRLYELQQGEK